MSRAAVMIAGNAPPAVCGIGDYTALLSAEMRRVGIPVVTWARAESGAMENESARTPAPRLDRAGVAAFAARLAAERPAVVHLQYEADSFDNNGFALLRLGLAARKTGAALVTTFHALDGPRPWGRAHRLALIPALLMSRDVVVCSRRQHTALARLPGISGKTHLIPVGSTVPVTGKRSCRKAGEPLRLVYFGFVWRGRNLETCVRAAAAVHAKTPAVLTIAGEIREESYRREIEALARTENMAGRVTFTDSLPAPALSQILADADLALLPFATGVSTGRSTFAAALDHGLPTVTMTVAENTILAFRHGENLLAVPAADREGFIRETVRLATDGVLRRAIAANTPALAQIFAWQEIARANAALPSYRGLADA